MPTYSFSYQQFENTSDLTTSQEELIHAAIKATEKSHAPYSKFHVGCAVLLANKKIISGSNIENASYPVGICAERSALSNVLSNHSEEKVLSLAVSYQVESNQKSLVFPCGMCRQFILECQEINESPIELILHAPNDSVAIISDASDLLPFGFTSKML
jgi:cytidine deaminase